MNQSITFNERDFKRKNSVDESLNLDDVEQNHESGVVPFQSESIDFNGELAFISIYMITKLNNFIINN